jgi:hypothetical protein
MLDEKNSKNVGRNKKIFHRSLKGKVAQLISRIFYFSKSCLQPHAHAKLDQFGNKSMSEQH